MYIGFCEVPPEIGKQCFDPDVVIQVVQTPNALEHFVDDQRNDRQITGCDCTVGKNGIILIAKDKDTMIRGLNAAAGKNVVSDTGTLILAQGRYGEVTWRRAKTNIMIRTPYLAKLLVNYQVLKIRAKGGYADWQDQRDITHEMRRRLLKGRGYFVFVMGRAAFTGPPPSKTVTYVGDYKTTWPALATLVSQGKDV